VILSSVYRDRLQIYYSELTREFHRER